MLSNLWLKLKTNYLIAIAVLIFLILSWSPIILGFFVAQKHNLLFTTAPIVNSGDHLYYLSQVAQGRQGHIFLQNLYNHQEQTRRLFAPHWYLIGQLGRLTGLSDIVAYQLARLCLQSIFIYLIYWWIKKIFINKKQHWWVLLLLLTANGLGSALYPWYKNTSLRPNNTWMPDSITFLGLQQGPLMILSQILLLLTLSFFVQAWETKNKKYLIGAIITFFYLIIAHPYDLPIIIAVTGLWSILIFRKTTDKKIFINFIYLVLAAIIPGLYYLWLIQDPVMTQLASQNILISPDLASYLVGFGLISPLAIGGIIYLFKNQTKNIYLLLILSWATIGWLLIYLPVDFNRRLVNGWHLALCIVAIIFAQYLYSKLKFFWQLLALMIFTLLLFADSLSYIKTSLVSSTNINMPDFFQRPAQTEAYEKIKNIGPAPKIFLTRGPDGGFLPAYTGQKVYIGHRMGTYQAAQKNEEVKKIWTSHTNISTWLDDKNIDYIYASRIDIPEFDDIKWLAHEPYITPLIDDADTILYQFTPQAK